MSTPVWNNKHAAVDCIIVDLLVLHQVFRFRAHSDVFLCTYDQKHDSYYELYDKGWHLHYCPQVHTEEADEKRCCRLHQYQPCCNSATTVKWVGAGRPLKVIDRGDCARQRRHRGHTGQQFPQAGSDEKTRSLLEYWFSNKIWCPCERFRCEFEKLLIQWYY